MTKPLMDVFFDAASVNRRFQAQGAAIKRGIRNGLDRGAKITLQQKLRQINNPTYKRPIPLNSKGVPRWERLGDWITNQEIRKLGDYSRAVIDTGPAAVPVTNHPGGYAEVMADRNTGPDGINRSNPAAAKTVAIVDPQVAEAMRIAINREIIR